MATKNDETASAEIDGKLRLFVDAPLAPGGEIELGDGQAHYVRNVMRARPGDIVQLFNGRDGEWRAALSLPGRRAARAKPVALARPQANAPDVWLCFAPIKKTAADYVAQKATELGASELRPVVTRRTVVSRVNVERMRANAVEAAEQSGRLDVPVCRDPATLSHLLSAWPAERSILFCDEGGAPPALEALVGRPRGPWAIFIGPEGGFDEGERAALRAMPRTVPVSLGARILRADTAALAALALWQAALGD